MTKEERALAYKYNQNRCFAKLANINWLCTLAEYNAVQHQPCYICKSTGTALRDDPTVVWNRVSLQNAAKGFVVGNMLAVCDRCYRNL